MGYKAKHGFLKKTNFHQGEGTGLKYSSLRTHHTNCWKQRRKGTEGFDLFEKGTGSCTKTKKGGTKKKGKRK